MPGNWPTSPSPSHIVPCQECHGIARSEAFWGSRLIVCLPSPCRWPQYLAHFWPDTLPGTTYLNETQFSCYFCSVPREAVPSMSSLLLFVEEVIVAVHGYQPPLALATQSAPHTEIPLAASIDVSADLCPGNHHHCDLTPGPGNATYLLPGHFNCWEFFCMVAPSQSFEKGIRAKRVKYQWCGWLLESIPLGKL